MDEEEEYVVIYSPLQRTLTVDGQTVEIQIYRGEDEDGWILEVVDEFNHSTIWKEQFESDQAALDKVFSTIEEEGIGAMIGPVPSSLKLH